MTSAIILRANLYITINFSQYYLFLLDFSLTFVYAFRIIFAETIIFLDVFQVFVLLIKRLPIQIPLGARLDFEAQPHFRGPSQPTRGCSRVSGSK